ncbi:ParA family protein, partial [Chamaesiphon polymorphus]
MLKIAVFNFKGGTGKSTSALNLGAVLAQFGIETLAIDLDGQRTLSVATRNYKSSNPQSSQNRTQINCNYP